jgi:hypothetical protein
MGHHLGIVPRAVLLPLQRRRKLEDLVPIRTHPPKLGSLCHSLERRLCHRAAVVTLFRAESVPRLQCSRIIRGWLSVVVEHVESVARCSVLSQLAVDSRVGMSPRAGTQSSAHILVGLLTQDAAYSVRAPVPILIGRPNPLLFVVCILSILPMAIFVVALSALAPSETQLAK